MARAARQRGVIVLAQLREMGVAPPTVRSWVARGRLQRLFRGAYVVGAVVPPLAPELAALLICGPRAAVSHRTAGHLYGLVAAPAEVHITVEGRRLRPRPGLRPHGTPALAAADVAQRHGLRVTTPARTIVDLAAELGEEDLDRAIQEAHARRLCTIAESRGAMGRAPGRRGTATLAGLLADAGGADLRSDGERRLRRLIRDAGLPAPEWNAPIGRWTVDAVWRERRVAVEFDGHAAHSSPWARDRDARKSADLQAAGWTLLRVTGRQVARRPHWVTARIAVLLGP